MLVLSRRVGESIVIGNDVVVTVLEARGDQVRIGVDAPRSVQVHREEVFREIEAENTSAAGAAARTQRLVARLPGTAAPRGTTPSRPAPSGLRQAPRRSDAE